MRRWNSPKSFLLLAVAGLISLAAVAACGGDDDKNDNGDATPTVTVESAAPPDGTPGPTSAGPSGSETSNGTPEPDAGATREAVREATRDVEDAARQATEDAQDAADAATREAEDTQDREDGPP